MSETTYVVEFAKSGRSKCKRCKMSIGKDEIRIQSSSHNDSTGMHISVSHHPVCFTKPRQYANVDDFIENALVDGTGGEILPAMASELAEQIAAAPPKAGGTGGKAEGGGGGGGDDHDPLAEIKRLYEENRSSSKSQEGSEEPSQKRAKMALVEAYEKYHKQTIPELKDVLRWNRQVLKGTKNLVLLKVVDGTARGRLARCELDGGLLKIADNGSHVVCAGTFDETASLRLDCPFQCSLEAAPRWKWFSEEPTEEEKEEMDRQVAEAKGEDVAGSGTNSDDLQRLQAAAAAQIAWDLSSRDGLRSSCQALTDLLVGHGLDQPTTKTVGAIIAANRSATLHDIVQLCVTQFGYAEKKAQKSAKQEEHLKAAIKCPDNAPLVAAFRELADLYAKTGNRNAAATYHKVVRAVTDLGFAVTKDNALGLGKGKTKVENIGKATAEKIHEFVTTGTMEKLEEKRVEAAN